MMNDLKVAFAFLTRISIRHKEPVRLAKSATWFPLVGFIIGLISGVSFYLASQVLPSLSASVVAILIGVLITGAFHQDGLADIFDGLVGGWDRKQRIDILKDSRHGTYGVTTLVLQFIFQIALLSSLSPGEGFVALVVMHSLARLVPIYLMLFPAAEGNQGMGASISREVGVKEILSATLLTLVLLVPLIGFYLIPLCLSLAFIVFVFYRYVKAKIGGIVGDALGAGEQISETVILIGLVALTFQGISWIAKF